MILLTCWAVTIAGDDPTAASVYDAGRRLLVAGGADRTVQIEVNGRNGRTTGRGVAVPDQPGVRAWPSAL